MDFLVRSIDIAVKNTNCDALIALFGDANDSWQSVGAGEQRSAAAHLMNRLRVAQQDPSTALDLLRLEDVLVRALAHLPTTVEGAADSFLRQALADVKINDEEPDYSGAARILGGMRMDAEENSVYYVPPAGRTEVYVKIAECFLAEDEIVEADAAVAKAGPAVEAISDKNHHRALILRYKSTYARVLDCNRKFLAAAQRYHELSQISNGDLIDPEELLQMLGRAVTCAILAPSGPQRQRMLQHIALDERLVQLGSLPGFTTHALILRQMYMAQIIKPRELEEFVSTLAVHQKAVMGDGLTILERSVVEHNMTAVSNLYRTIYLSELAHILGVDVRKAEKIAASMFIDGPLQGSIDQVHGLIEFQQVSCSSDDEDRAILNWCMELNKVTDAVKEISQSSYS